MAFLGKGRRCDLLEVADELGEEVESSSKVIDIKKQILNSKNYCEEEVKLMLDRIISDRVMKEQEEKNMEKDREIVELRKNQEIELEKFRLQLESQKIEPPNAPNNLPKLDVSKFLPKFNSDNEDINLFLILFERQMKILKITENLWVTHLLGTLPSDIAKLLAREPEDKFENYSHIRKILLERFKMTAQKFRNLFYQSRKTHDSTWKDFYFETQSYLEGRLTELKITTFEELKNLMISDLMKSKCDIECKEHFLDKWETLNSPEELAEKLEQYDNVRKMKPLRKNYDVSKGSYRPSPFRKDNISNNREYSNTEFRQKIQQQGEFRPQNFNWGPRYNSLGQNTRQFPSQDQTPYYRNNPSNVNKPKPYQSKLTNLNERPQHRQIREHTHFSENYPSEPCKFCDQHGITNAFHWEQECINKTSDNREPMWSIPQSEGETRDDINTK